MGIVVGLYVLWVAVTYLLEGLPRTLLRPEAQGARLAYTVIANLVVGTLGSMVVLRRLIAVRAVRPVEAGFGPWRRSLIASGLGLVTGGVLYVAQGAPSLHPVVVLNTVAQVLPVSIAEVLVCWSLAGTAAASTLAARAGRAARGLVTAVVASILFGLYHVAHSPPFNTPAMIALLTVVGLATSVFFLATRDVYGTIAFHTFLGLFGVVRTLAAVGELGRYETVRLSLLTTATVALGLLIVSHAALLRGRGPDARAA